MAMSKQSRRLRIKRRIRKKISGTQERPRLSVFRSNKGFYAQLINDATGVTILSVSSSDKSIAGEKMNKIDQAKAVGKLAAQKSSEAGVKQVVFDRNGYLYHGRVQAFAEAAREGGLNI